MRKAALAEAILSLAATPESAEAITGDFLEEDRGAFRFWLTVGRTIIAQAWRQMAATPKAIASLAVRSMLAELGFKLAACVIYALLLCIAISIAKVSFHADTPGWFNASVGWLLRNLVLPLWVGRWMSRYAGHEAAGTFTLAGLHTTINLCAGWILAEAARMGSEAQFSVILGLKLVSWDSEDSSAAFHSAIVCATLYPLLLLVGATLSRKRGCFDGRALMR